MSFPVGSPGIGRSQPLEYRSLVFDQQHRLPSSEVSHGLPYSASHAPGARNDVTTVTLGQSYKSLHGPSQEDSSDWQQQAGKARAKGREGGRDNRGRKPYKWQNKTLRIIERVRRFSGLPFAKVKDAWSNAGGSRTSATSKAVKDMSSDVPSKGLLPKEASGYRDKYLEHAITSDQEHPARDGTLAVTHSSEHHPTRNPIAPGKRPRDSGPRTDSADANLDEFEDILVTAGVKPEIARHLVKRWSAMRTSDTAKSITELIADGKDYPCHSCELCAYLRNSKFEARQATATLLHDWIQTAGSLLNITEAGCTAIYLAVALGLDAVSGVLLWAGAYPEEEADDKHRVMRLGVMASQRSSDDTALYSHILKCADLVAHGLKRIPMNGRDSSYALLDLCGRLDNDQNRTKARESEYEERRRLAAEASLPTPSSLPGVASKVASPGQQNSPQSPSGAVDRFHDRILRRQTNAYIGANGSWTSPDPLRASESEGKSDPPCNTMPGLNQPSDFHDWPVQERLKWWRLKEGRYSEMLRLARAEQRRLSWLSVP